MYYDLQQQFMKASHKFDLFLHFTELEITQYNPDLFFQEFLIYENFDIIFSDLKYNISIIINDFNICSCSERSLAHLLKLCDYYQLNIADYSKLIFDIRILILKKNINFSELSKFISQKIYSGIYNTCVENGFISCLEIRHNNLFAQHLECQDFLLNNIDLLNINNYDFRIKNLLLILQLRFNNYSDDDLLLLASTIHTIIK